MEMSERLSVCQFIMALQLKTIYQIPSIMEMLTPCLLNKKKEETEFFHTFILSETIKLLWSFFFPSLVIKNDIISNTHQWLKTFL